MKEKLNSLALETPGLISDVRGLGTFLGFDVVQGQEARDKLVFLLRERGVNAHVCSKSTMRLRPSLYFGNSHADIFLETLKKALSKI